MPGVCACAKVKDCGVFFCLVSYVPHGFAALVAHLSKLLTTVKSLHLEHLTSVCCSATFSVPTKW